MKVLVIGASGMLGGSITRYLSKTKKYEVLSTVRTESQKKVLNEWGIKNVKSCININCDDMSNLEKIVKEFKPQYIINCVGIIKQLGTKINIDEYIEINSILPHKLSLIGDKYNAKLIHFSTDCVFSGLVGNYVESDMVDAKDIYGKTKYLGEINNPYHLTLRTSIIGHEVNRKISLIDWFLAQNKTVNGFTKAFFTGMPSVYIAEILHKEILNRGNITGLYHLGVNPIDKYTLLNIVKKQYNKKIEIIKNNDYKINRSLNSNKIKKIIKQDEKSWEELIKKMHNEYKEYYA